MADVADTVDEAAIRANRLDLLARLADDLAHEVKNPLHAMVINLELVKRRAEAGDVEAVGERADVVVAEAQRVHELVDQLLGLLRPPRSAEPVTELGAALRRLAPLLRARAKVAQLELELRLEAASAHVPLSAPLLEQVVLNLVENAMDASRRGGTVTLSSRARNDEVVLGVRDQGAGFDAEPATLARSGYTTRKGRAGLGLAVVQTLVERAGGRLDLESGGGATSAAVRLPRAGGAA